jgi:hypothetical protein
MANPLAPPLSLASRIIMHVSEFFQSLLLPPDVQAVPARRIPFDGETGASSAFPRQTLAGGFAASREAERSTDAERHPTDVGKKHQSEPGRPGSGSSEQGIDLRPPGLGGKVIPAGLAAVLLLNLFLACSRNKHCGLQRESGAAVQVELRQPHKLRRGRSGPNCATSISTSVPAWCFTSGGCRASSSPRARARLPLSMTETLSCSE